MREISHEQVANWARSGDVKVPEAIRTVCWSCRIWASFPLPFRHEVLQGGALVGYCSQCNARIEVFTSKADGELRVWVHPSPPMRDGVPIEEIPELGDLVKMYRSACRNFDAGDETACVILARSVLDRMLRQTLNVGDGMSLSKMIQKIPDATSLLARPAQAIADAIGEGGGAGSHVHNLDGFDAEELLDLLDFLLLLLYLTPADAGKLSQKFAAARAVRAKARAGS